MALVSMNLLQLIYWGPSAN